MNHDSTMPASPALAADLSSSDTATRPASAAQHPNQRLGRKYYFDDPDMDLFFMAALSWGPTGGLDIGQAFQVASSIIDGDGDSWVHAFDAYGDVLNAQADTWKQR